MLSICIYGILLYTIGKVLDWITFLYTGGTFVWKDKLLISASILFIILFIMNGGI